MQQKISRRRPLSAWMPLLALCLSVVGAPALAAHPSKVSSAQFVVFGDAGTGLPAQYAVGEAMAQVCAVRGCEFGIELGDNFYPDGVRGVNDPQFQEKFEKPYAPLDFPIYVALGNHDTGGNGAWNNRGDFQVDYANSGRSAKFRMPARYYRFTVPPKPRARTAPFAEFYALDSSAIVATAKDRNPNWDPEAYGAKQLAWFEDALSKSAATWKIAFAHHAYVSNGEHGNAGNYAHPSKAIPTASGQVWRGLLDRTVCRHGVDLFLAGHDHDMEWLQPVSTCGKTQFIISGSGGAGASPLLDRHLPYNWHATYTYGFFWMKLRKHKLTVAAYTLNPDLKLPVDEGGKPVSAFEKTLTR